MTPLLRALAGLLATAYVVTAALPCEPVLERPTAAASVAAEINVPDAGEPATSVSALCPCGCKQRNPVRSGGSVGCALLRSEATRPFAPPAALPLAFAAPALPGAPDFGIDPIPV